MARVINSMIEGLNSKEQLPKYVLVVMDKDLIENVNYFEFGLADIMDECVFWMVKEANKLFEIRREDLRRRKPGALSTATEPRLVWLAMIQHPMVHDNFKKVYSKRSKFNKALEDAVSRFKYHHIMFVDGLMEAAHFDTTWRLTAAGKEEM